MTGSYTRLLDNILYTGGFILYFFIFCLCNVFNTASSAAPSDSTVSEDARIEPYCDFAIGSIFIEQLA
jgi:hypothetical protein